MFPLAWPLGVLWLLLPSRCTAAISRLDVVDQFTLERTNSNAETPFQVGNGNFAFNADITGLQSIKPFNILSSWGWHSDPLPKRVPHELGPRSNEQSVEILDCWWLHEKAWKPPNSNLVSPSLPLTEDPLPESENISYSEWKRRNPHRINLGRIGLLWNGEEINPKDLSDTKQKLRLSTGVMTSSFFIQGNPVELETVAAPLFDAVGIKIQSEGMLQGNLSVFLDFPYPVSNKKFEAPFMGSYNVPSQHTTSQNNWSTRSEIKHTIDNTTYFVNVQWDTGVPMTTFKRLSSDAHRYIFNLTDAMQSSFVFHFSPDTPAFTPRYDVIKDDTKWFWNSYWNSGAFVDCSSTNTTQATELQRRVIQSQYLMAVNAAGSEPPQESGLVNNGWYGKFHMEMGWWHLAHWQRWSKWARVGSVLPSIYTRFLSSSQTRAQSQGFDGARWGKMTDLEGNNSPGEINQDLIWQQPHPFFFAEQEYLANPNAITLRKWHDILEKSAAFMTSFAKYNKTTKLYDLNPPIHIVSENTKPAETRNPAFELAYWRFGLNIMTKWYQRQKLSVPSTLTSVYNNLAPFPIENDRYVHYEGLRNMWTTPKLTSNHPALSGLFGMLPSDPRLNMTVFANTMSAIYASWNMTDAYGWDFPLLAMTALRMGDAMRAVELLLDPQFRFDDAGMPVGGRRVPTPYFPSSGGLLMAVGMMAGGWGEFKGRQWPTGWSCEAEGFGPGI